MKNKKGSYALADILRERDAEKYAALIERAALGGFHDFKHDIIEGHPEWGDDVCPKVACVNLLLQYPELADVVAMVIKGDFDDSADAEDDARLAKEFGEDFMSIFKKKKD